VENVVVDAGSSYPETLSRNEERRMQRKHILVVSSAVEFVGLLRELLIDERYNVTTTNYLTRTYEQIEALQPDLLMIDIVIQQYAGWDLLVRLRAAAETRDIPIIVTSTDPRLLKRAELESERYGGSRWVVQPFEIEALLNTVESLVGTAERS
jgi:two-component system, sensor histidine kinase and response regulator